MPYPFYNPYMPNMSNNPYMPQQTPFGAFNQGVMPQMQQPPMNTPPQQYAAQNGAQPPKTNKILVTSVEEAMARQAEPNTDMLYVHQDLPMVIQVYTDWNGHKTPQLFDIIPHKEAEAANADLSKYVTAEEFDGVKGEINGLKEQLAKLSRRSKKDEQPIE